MGKDKKKMGRKDTWYCSDEEVSKHNDEDLSGNEENILIKSKSLDAQYVKRPKKSFIFKLKANKMQQQQQQHLQVKPVIKSKSTEWLEGMLLRRQSETRKYKHNTRLLESIFDGDTAKMSRMLAIGASPNATCRLNHVSACHLAAMYSHEALALLLTAGAERIRLDKVGRSPLHLAAWEGNARQIAMLLDFPKDLQESVACDDISLETLEKIKEHSKEKHPLINIPCEINRYSTCPNDWGDGMEHDCRHTKNALPFFEVGWTALHAASARTHYQCVKILLAAGADVQGQDLLCKTPIDVVGAACFMGHQIQVSNFKETIKVLLKAGCKLQSNPPEGVNNPLHIAVTLGNEEAVDDLLNNGASVTVRNKQGLTAMHICVKKRNKELLQLLLNYEDSNENRPPAAAVIDTLDSKGFSILHEAIREEWLQGVCIALGAGASVTTLNYNGQAPIHTAAAYGNIDIFQEVLNIAKYNFAINYRNVAGETALLIAVRSNKIEIVKLLLKAGAVLNEVTPKYVLNVFHVAAKYGVTEILKYLLEFNSSNGINIDMINNRSIKTYTPLAYAVLFNHPECVELLISKGALVNIRLDQLDVCTGIIKETTPLHIAAEKNHYEIAKMIIKHDIETINVVNSEGKLPLHEACFHGNRETIKLLLENGADLSGQNEFCKTKLSPIALLMNNLSKPTEFMKEIFDSCISSQGMNLQERNCEVTVNYDILVPNKSSMKQMSVINALVNTGNRYEQQTLLVHPLVQSFLYRKWKALLPFLYTILCIQGCFVLALNIYVVSIFYFKDKHKQVAPYFQTTIWRYILLLATCIFAIQEILFVKISNKRYFLALETWFKSLAIVLALMLQTATWWDPEYNSEWPRLIATLALLSSWFSMMFLLSRFPDWGFYVLMFGKVASKVFKILLSFLFLILGFSFCFMIQFRATAPFEGPWSAFVKTIVMMTSEYDYQTIINKESAQKISASLIILRIIFLIFLIVVSIVLMNIIVGVAVNNVNHLEMIGNIKRLQKQIELITSLEEIVNNKLLRNILPKRIFRRWLVGKKFKNSIVLRPREARCSYCDSLPTHIREAIFDTAHLQKKLKDDELGSKVFNDKLNEIHNAIVVKSEVKKNELGEDDLKNKLTKEISEIRCDLEIIKQLLASNRRRTIGCKNTSFL